MNHHVLRFPDCLHQAHQDLRVKQTCVQTKSDIQLGQLQARGSWKSCLSSKSYVSSES